MTDLNMREAAEAAGTSKRVLLRAIRSGRIAATRRAGGGWAIPETEIERLFTSAHARPAVALTRSAAEQPEDPAVTPEAMLAMEVAAMQRFLAAEARRAERATRNRQAAAEQDVRPWWRRLAG